jgi:hypothetical protein
MVKLSMAEACLRDCPEIEDSESAMRVWRRVSDCDTYPLFHCDRAFYDAARNAQQECAGPTPNTATVTTDKSFGQLRALVGMETTEQTTITYWICPMRALIQQRLHNQDSNT